MSAGLCRNSTGRMFAWVKQALYLCMQHLLYAPRHPSHDTEVPSSLAGSCKEVFALAAQPLRPVHPVLASATNAPHVMSGGQIAWHALSALFLPLHGS